MHPSSSICTTDELLELGFTVAQINDDLKVAVYYDDHAMAIEAVHNGYSVKYPGTTVAKLLAEEAKAAGALYDMDILIRDILIWLRSDQVEVYITMKPPSVSNLAICKIHSLLPQLYPYDTGTGFLSYRIWAVGDFFFLYSMPDSIDREENLVLITEWRRDEIVVDVLNYHDFWIRERLVAQLIPAGNYKAFLILRDWEVNISSKLSGTDISRKRCRLIV